MAQDELARPSTVDSGGCRDDRAVQVESGRVVSSAPRDLVERHIGGLAVRPGHMDRRRGVAGRVDLINDEVPFGVVTAVIGERPRLYGNGLRVGGLARYGLPSHVATRRTRTQEHEGEADQAEHPSDE